MKNIVFTRIDDRLIHGQVMTAWLSYHQANEIVIVDNVLAEDDFTKMIMQSLVPEEIDLQVFSIAEATDYFKQQENGEKIIILVKTPHVVAKLIEGGVDIPTLNVGGMGMKTGREKLYKNITASPEEKKVFNDLIAGGMNVFVQVVPQDKAVDLSKYL